MESLFNIVYLVITISGAVFFLYASIISFFEKENRASLIFGSLIIVALIFAFLGFTNFIPVWFFSAFDIFIVLSLAILFLPIRKAGSFPGNPCEQIDERTIMFSRAKLEPGTQRYNDYYTLYPDHKTPDDKFRKSPGLLKPGTTYYDKAYFHAADINFNTVNALHPLVDGIASKDHDNLVEDIDYSVFLHQWVKKLGAHSSGATLLRPYHTYSTIGRGSDYGKSVELNHKYAFAFTVEMDKSMMDASPMAPVVFESSQQYLKSGTIAVQVAQWIRSMGYEARAHIDGNYRVVCPLVARDAGLGEIGRMGLLMTPRLGPRVRIAVVTTNMPLSVTPRKADPSVDAFCSICRKCAYTCPAAAIPKAGKKLIDGVNRWQINQEKCYTLWCKVGTDCGKCMRVCPYSHPDNLLHNIIRWGIKHNGNFRRMAVVMDDVFYGKNPKPRNISKK